MFAFGGINIPHPNHYILILDNGNVISAGNNNSVMMWDIEKYMKQNNDHKSETHRILGGNIIHTSDSSQYCFAKLPDNQIMIGLSNGSFEILNINEHENHAVNFPCNVGGPLKIMCNHHDNRVCGVHMSGILSIWN